MISGKGLFFSAAACCLILTGCDKIPGDPVHHKHWEAPDQVKDFTVLYTRNCQGCHSLGNGVSASIALDDPNYLAWVPREKMIAVISDGVPKTAMPAFNVKNGGALTDEQIAILVDGFLVKKPAQAPAGLPPYEGGLGNAAKGKALLEAVYGPEKAAEWSNPYFLATVSDQYLRTLVVVGRPELGYPAWNQARAGAPLSNEEIADIVAWLASQRYNPAAAGQTKGGS